MLTGVVLALLAAAFSRLPGLGIEFVAASIGLFAAACVLLLFLALRHLDAKRFGAANGVTLLRLALTAMLSALLLARVETALLWLCIGVATAVLLLDGVDGKLARRYGMSSRFGARFDMEVDALLILVLALLAWHFERAGIWVLFAGLLRYMFVGAAAVIPWMRATLPPSLRRKTVCIVQSAALLVCMGPIIPAELGIWVAAAGVALLAWSFAVDVFWLYARHRSEIHA
jgi:phosphatidylglycerophosphate synthase